VTCATTETPYKGNVVHFNLDKAIVINGKVTVSRDCSIQLENVASPPKP
jgi:hypothetical protein